jgi:type VI secretion system protein ImpA
MSTDLFEFETLVAPLAEGAPCGADLAYDPAFQALETAGQGVPERQYGDKLFPAEPPDWMAVYEHALALAQRTRDIRVAVWLTRAAARLHGMAGVHHGLRLLQGLVEQHWAHVHPQLDADDGGDPTMRLNAFSSLYARDAALADIRSAALAPVRGGPTLRELELALGRDAAHADEAAPTEAGLLQALSELKDKHPQLSSHLEGASAAATAIDHAARAAVGERGADAQALIKLLGCGPSALQRLRGEAAEGEAGAEGAADGAALGAAGGRSGSIRTRADAVRELERVCEWLERSEPGHPAPLLIRRAQRLLNMSFLEIIRDMAPGGLDQVQNLAGSVADS